MSRRMPRPAGHGRFKSTAALVGAIVTAAVPISCLAAAADGDVLERLKALETLIETQKRQIEAQQRDLEAGLTELEALKTQLQAREAEAAKPPEPPASMQQTPEVAQATVGAEPAEATFERGRPIVTSRDRQYSLSVRGRAQFDAAAYYQDEAGPLDTDWRRGSVGGGRENIAATDLSSGRNFRRAQLGIEGQLGHYFSYRLMPEFGGSGTEDNPRLHEAWLGYSSRPSRWNFQLGVYAPPANLDDSSSSDDTMFLERATPAELSRALAGADGRVAGGLTGHGRRWFAALHLTGSTYGAEESFDEQVSAVGRIAALAFTGDNYNVHVGFNGSYVMQPADTGGGATAARYIRFRDRPELRVDSTRLIDTGPILAENAYAVGVEFAANWRNFTIEAEAFRYGIGRANDTGHDNPHFNGWYAEASYLLLGERRPYDVRVAAYASPRPATSGRGATRFGALEFAVRYSHANLNFREGSEGLPPPPGGIRGGEQNNWSIGLNWHPTPNTKFMFDYQHISVDRLNPAGPENPEPFGPGINTPPIGVQIGQTLGALAFRSQYSF